VAQGTERNAIGVARSINSKSMIFLAKSLTRQSAGAIRRQTHD
jgi:hypothetical protein